MRKQTKLVIFIPLAIIIAIAFYGACYVASSDIAEITVVRLERETKNSGNRIESKYMVTAEDEVFENTDSTLFWKFNSSDVQRELREGCTYKVHVAGWRIPFFSAYRNIITVEGKLADKDPLPEKVLERLQNDPDFRAKVEELMQ